jgi:hypothetical protein
MLNSPPGSHTTAAVISIAHLLFPIDVSWHNLTEDMAHSGIS